MALNIFRFWLAMTLAGIALVSSCTCRHGQVGIHEIVIEIPPNFDRIATPEAQKLFREEIINQLNESPKFYFRQNPEGENTLQIGFLPEGIRNSKKWLMFAEVWSKKTDSLSLSRVFSNLTLVNGALVKEEFSAGVQSLLSRLGTLAGGREADYEEFIELVDKANSGEEVDASELVLAVSVLADSNIAGADEKLVKLLENTTDLALGSSLVAALGKMRAQGAMPAIIEFSARKPAIFRRQAIIAAKSIATQEALEWLFVMANGYQDAKTRQEALQAAQEVEKSLKETKQD